MPILSLVVALLAAGYPLLVVYQKEGLSELSPRVVIVAFLTCVVVVLCFVGSYLFALVPWYFAIKIALKKDDTLGPGGSSKGGSTEDGGPDKINNLF